MRTKDLTCKAQVPEGLFVPFQMIIDAEPLVILVQCTKFSEERKILSRILRYNKQNVSNVFLIAFTFQTPVSDKPHACKYGDKLGQPVVSQE